MATAITELTSLWLATAPIAVTWLLTFSIHSTLLLLLVWLVSRGPRSHQLRDTLWKAAMLGGFITATLSAVLVVQPLTGRIDLSSNPDGVASRQPTEDPYQNRDPAPDAAEQAIGGSGGVASGYSGDLTTSPTLSLSEVIGAAIQASSSWLLGLWLLGVMLACSKLVLARWRLLDRLRHRKYISDDPITDTLAQLLKASGVHRPVRVSYSSRISSPMALSSGEICLPSRILTDFDHEKLESTLAHEVAHLARRDPAWLLSCRVLESLFFFQPLLRLARRRLQECAEYLCDDWTARHTGSGLALAKCLVEVAGWPHIHSRPLGIPGMGEATPTLEQRVRRLLDSSRWSMRESPRWWWKTLVAGMLVLILFVAPAIGLGATSLWPNDGTWVLLNQIEIEHLTTVAGFLDETYGIAAQAHGDVYITSDGGETWSAAESSYLSSRGLDIVDRQVAWYCGVGGRIRLSTDGGRTWIAVSNTGNGSDVYCRQLSFLDANLGWAAAIDLLEATVDGGQTWTDVALPDGIQRIEAIDLRSATDGYVLDNWGNLYITNDGGLSWTTQSLGPLSRNGRDLPLLTTPAAAMRFVDANHGLIVYSLVGGGASEVIALRTDDGGVSWVEEIVSYAAGTLYLSNDGSIVTILDLQGNVEIHRYE